MRASGNQERSKEKADSLALCAGFGPIAGELMVLRWRFKRKILRSSAYARLKRALVRAFGGKAALWELPDWTRGGHMSCLALLFRKDNSWEEYGKEKKKRALLGGELEKAFPGCVLEDAGWARRQADSGGREMKFPLPRKELGRELARSEARSIQEGMNPKAGAQKRRISKGQARI